MNAPGRKTGQRGGGGTPRLSPLVARIGGEGAEAWGVHVEAVKRLAAGEDVIALTIGDPDFDTPRAIVEAAVTELRAGNTHYAGVFGVALTTAIARYQSGLSGRDISPGEVTPLLGAQNALFSAALCLFAAGDEVIVPEPAYVTYEAVLGACGARIVWVPLRAERGFHIDPVDVAAAITDRTRGILLNFPHNPTGALLSDAAAEEIAGLCRAHDLWLISDEVYSSLIFEGRHSNPCALPGMAERSVIVNSVSKSHAMTGWRLGWAVAPKLLTEAIGKLSLCMLFGSPSFTQAALATWLGRELPELAEMKQAYRRRRDLAFQRLSGVPGLRPHNPESGMFMMVDVRGTGLSAADFAFRLLEAKGVSVLPADPFGPSATGHVRISFAIDEATLAEACNRIAAFVEETGRG
jgi:arginine:pyruvate transaminase